MTTPFMAPPRAPLFPSSSPGSVPAGVARARKPRGFVLSALHVLTAALCGLAALLCGSAAEASAATLPAGFVETKLIGGINPTFLEVAPDGRVFFCEKQGLVRILKDGKPNASPFLTLDVDSWQERGLLGIALDPDFANNPYVYLYYTAKTPAAHNRISRFRANGDTAGGPEQVLLDLDNLTAIGWHNSGSIHFGKDGKLYIAAGNNTNNVYSQSLDALLGKILRINPDGSIPADNPFYNTATGSHRAIWALGLRNPFTTAIHPVTGALFIDDVGEGTYEEIDSGKAGSNYGWPKTEGHAATAPTGLIGSYVDPMYWYPHSGTCAITGGAFYHPQANTFGAEYLDLYFFSDYCGGWIKTLDPAHGAAIKSFATGIDRPITLKSAPDGSLYYVDRGVRAAGIGAGSAEDNTSTADGAIYRIVGPLKPTALGSVTKGANPGAETWAVANVFGAAGMAVPAGIKHVDVYDGAGRKAWEWNRGSLRGTVTARIPEGLGRGVFRAIAR